MKQTIVRLFAEQTDRLGERTEKENGPAAINMYKLDANIHLDSKFDIKRNCIERMRDTELIQVLMHNTKMKQHIKIIAQSAFNANIYERTQCH